MIYPILEPILYPCVKKRISKIEGEYNIPKDTNFIVAVNHWTTSDSLFVIASFLPHIQSKLYYICSDDICLKVFRPIVSKFLGVIFRDQNNKGECLEQAKKFLLAGKYLGMFPEGRLNKDGLVKGKTGTARLHLWTHKPIVPVGITGIKQIKTKGLINLARILSSGTTAEIKIGKPLSFPEYFDQEITKPMLEDITRQIMLELGRLSGQEYKY